jgi:hypothetical protein
MEDNLKITAIRLCMEMNSGVTNLSIEMMLTEAQLIYDWLKKEDIA